MKFTPFTSSIEAYTVPELFPDPYNHSVHPLCQLAAEELQQYLKTQCDFQYDFDIENRREEKNLGKMFGVLVVKDKENRIGYLSAFSGFLSGKTVLPRFVPPVFDILGEASLYQKGEREIDEITRNIKDIEESDEYKAAVQNLESARHESAAELDALKKSMEQGRLARKKIRNEKGKELNEEEFLVLEEELQNLSRKDKYDFREVKKSWKLRIDELQNICMFYTDKIEKLKQTRKQKSATLQQYIFSRYNFLNQAKESVNVCEIFADTPLKVPPASAGDCAAPKLLQYAFLNDLKPLALAEFWWGQAPESVVRRHGFFYPPCKGKCQPILKHMLRGIAAEEFVLNKNSEELTIDILFEDESVAVINKPAGLLSVPGNAGDDSVLKRMKERYPHASGPMIVHRLDMSTSGIMVIARTDAAYKNLQNQFLRGTVKKKYTALLDGIPEADCGEINLPLTGDYNERPRQRVCYETGKEARTRYRVLDVYSGEGKKRSRVEFDLLTGRTHQLRVHAAHYKGLNVPICGDALYGIAGERLFLHAKSVEFSHPATGVTMAFYADEDFQHIKYGLPESPERDCRK